MKDFLNTVSQAHIRLIGVYLKHLEKSHTFKSSDSWDDKYDFLVDCIDRFEDFIKYMHKHGHDIHVTFLEDLNGIQSSR